MATKPKSIRYKILIPLLIFIHPLGLLLMWTKSRWRKRIKILISLPILLLLFVLVNYFYLLRIFEVSGNAMFPTAHDGQYLLSTYGLTKSSINRGDIILFSYENTENSVHIARAIGLTGDTVAIRDKRIYVNNVEIEEKYLSPGTSTIFDLNPNGENEQTVPEGYILVLGDNREYSSDSRERGLIKVDKVIGKVVYLF